MIVTEIHEPDKFNKYKRVYYRSNDRVIRKALINSDGCVVKDYLYEYNDDLLIDSIVLFSKDHITIAGIKKYYYYEGSNSIKSTEEIKYKNNTKIRVLKTVHEYNDVDKTCIVTIYGGSEEPVGYEYYGYRKGDDFMSLLGCFNKDNEKISCLDFKYEKLF